MKSSLLESGGDAVEHFDAEGAGQLVARDFDAGEFAVVADAKLAEAELANGLFTAFHLLKNFAGHGAAIFHSR